MTEINETQEPTKRCPNCGRDLPYSAFKVCKKAKDGLMKRCIECNDKDMASKAARTPVNIAEQYEPFLRGY